MTLTPKAIAEDSCARDPNRMTVVMQLTRSGQQKISRIAYETARRSMGNMLKSVPADIQEFGADPNICKRPNIEHLSAEKIKNDCFGFLPEPLWNGDLPNASIDRLEPVTMKMSNLKFKHLALNKNPSINCQNNVCDVTAGVDQLDMGFDISAKSVNETCDQVALKNVKLALDPRATRKPTKVHLKFRYTNDVNNPVQVMWDNSQIVIPADAVRYQATSVTQGNNLCKKNQNIQKVTAELVADLVAKNQYVMNQILDVVKTNALKEIADQQITELARANGIGRDKYISAVIPSIKQITRDGALKGATQDQVNLADEYLDTIISAKSSVELASAIADNDLAPSFLDYLSSFKSSKSETKADMAQALMDKWISNSKEISHLESQSNDPNIKSMLRKENERIKAVVNNLDQVKHGVKIGLETKDEGEKLALVLTALQANDLQSEIEAKINACYRCRTTGIQATTGAEWGFENGDHDIAIKTGYGTINQFLAVMQANHGLDTCVIQGARRDCNDARPNDVKIDVHFPNAPEIFWNPESNSFAFRVKQIQLTNQNGTLGKIARKMEADVVLPGALTVENDGKTIHFTPIPEKIKVSNPDFKAAEWDWTRIASGLVAWAAEKMADTAFSHRLMQKALTIDVDMPETATLSQVKATPQGFGVYLNLPDDPTLLLPPENGARTLAGNKSKLK